MIMGFVSINEKYYVLYVLKWHLQQWTGIMKVSRQAMPALYTVFYIWVYTASMVYELFKGSSTNIVKPELNRKTLFRNVS
jgi:hypothetical protein